MSNEVVIGISSQCIEDTWIKALPEDATEEQIVEAAMKGSFDVNCTWMAGSDNDKFMCGLAALARHYMKDEEMMDRMRHEIANLKALNAMTSGVPVDIEALVNRQEDAPKPVGLNRAFLKAMGEAKG
jgi:hypothetical protein